SAGLGTGGVLITSGYRLWLTASITILLFSVSLSSCHKEVSETAQSGETAYSFEIYPTALSLFPEELPIEKADIRQAQPASLNRPVGGTVSHHLLAAEGIDLWFQSLAVYGKIDTFIIISPVHWATGGAALKITDLPWDAGFGIVECDTEAVEFLSESVPLNKEREAFHLEHGIGSLIPYIAAYFPGSRVVPILQREETLDTDGLGDLAAAIGELVVSNPRTRYFLMVSADFSHHAGIETTGERDSRTESVLPTLLRKNLPLMYSDNRGGLLLLSEFLGGVVHDYRLIGHTNSYKISGMDKEDITSYFFTLYW
ncbi:MAG: AmmeMemoRadiSam system protein B, partial [Spirochaetes bacterium]